MIIQDSRQPLNPSGKIIERRLRNIQSAFMPYGDYLLRGHECTVLVEVVTASGLLADIESGRMVDKLRGCAGEGDIVVLLVIGMVFPGRDGKAMIQEGQVKATYFNLPRGPWEEGCEVSVEMRKTRFGYRAFQEFLTSACLRWCHKVEFAGSAVETAERLKEMDEYFSKPVHHLHLVRARPFCMSGEDDPHEAILTGFPGIGTERAKAIIGHFGGKAPLAWTVGEKALAGVHLIGKTTARKLVQTVPSFEGVTGVVEPRVTLGVAGENGFAAPSKDGTTVLKGEKAKKAKARRVKP